MKDTIYLKFNKHGIKSMSKGPPGLSAHEFATRLDIDVDDKYFDRIIPIAYMKLDDKFLIEPKIEMEPIEKVEGEEINE